VKGGIKARSARGAFVDTWWGKRWVQTLENFNIGARLGRGKKYARSGQVSSLEIGAGQVRANVQGTRPRPYSVSISLRAFSAEQWKTIIDELSSQPIHTARLLNNEMPEELENVVSVAGAPLFPVRYTDLATECSCPDWSNPCKHIAAVFYILAEAFDGDPFLLLRLRGMDREQLMAALRGSNQRDEDADDVAATEALPLDRQSWWEWSPDASTSVPLSDPPAVNAALPRRLGPLPFWRSDTPFLEVMEIMYRQISCDMAAWYPDMDESAEDMLV
jgi:uncharacterized Zn finger protein